MKKILCLFITICAMIGLSGCSSESVVSFDASGYVEGFLNNIYYGDSSLYREFVDISKEDALEEYEFGIQVETDYLLDSYGIDTVSEDIENQINEFYKEVYQKAKFTVQEAEKDGDSFKVEVIIYPIDLFSQAADELDDAFYQALEADYESEEAMDNGIATSLIPVLNKYKDSFGYEEPQSVMITVFKGEDGLWGTNDDAVSSVDAYIINYDDIN